MMRKQAKMVEVSKGGCEKRFVEHGTNEKDVTKPVEVNMKFKNEMMDLDLRLLSEAKLL